MRTGLRLGKSIPAILDLYKHIHGSPTDDLKMVNVVHESTKFYLFSYRVIFFNKIQQNSGPRVVNLLRIRDLISQVGNTQKLVDKFDDEMRENLDPAQAAELLTDFAVNTDENYEDQGFLWMCGICENGATFETIYDLFNHKKETEHLAQARRKLDPESPYAPHTNSNDSHVDLSDCDVEKRRLDKGSQNESVESVSPPSPCSSEDIPLANLPPKYNSVADKCNNTEKKGLVNLKKDNPKSSNVNENAVDKEICENIINHIDQGNNDDAGDGTSLKKKSLAYESSKADDKPDEILDEMQEENDKQEDNSENLNGVKKCEMKIEDKSTKLKTKHLCKICNSEFPSRFALSVHKKTHLYKDTGCYKCETCGKMCPKYDNFTRHLTIHYENREKSHQCSHCFASFYNLADLKRHLVLHLSVKPFTCEHCGEGFTRQDSLLIHAYKHTGVLYMKYACKDCDKVLNSQSALVMHVKTHSVKTVFCPEPGCKFSCYLQSQLRQHFRKHSGEKPFQCAKCGRCFARSNDMKNHILSVHENVRPFRCSSCPKEFAFIGNLRIHNTIHTNERPYLCAQCGKSFNHPSTLRKHSVTVHSPWRNQDKRSRAKRISSPQSLLTHKNGELKKVKGKSKEIFIKDTNVS